MAERGVARDDGIVPVPDDVDPALAASLGIAGLAGWLPLEWRAPVRDGETVLVLGATGTLGLVAVQAAKILGAGRVVAAGRRPEGLERARRAGADATVQLNGAENLADGAERGVRRGRPERSSSTRSGAIRWLPLCGGRPGSAGRPDRPVGRRRGSDPVGIRARQDARHARLHEPAPVLSTCSRPAIARWSRTPQPAGSRSTSSGCRSIRAIEAWRARRAVPTRSSSSSPFDAPRERPRSAGAPRAVCALRCRRRLGRS